MAAKSTSSNGKKNYYNISYGKLSTRVKEVPEHYNEYTEDFLKSSTSKVENIDFRNKYIKKSGDYPYAVFYDEIEGKIVDINKIENEYGVTLGVTMLDSDGEESVIQTKMYSRYSENFLNRLSNLKNIETLNIKLRPYAMPTEFDGTDGNKIKMYSQGISVYVDGDKVEIKYNHENKKLPALQKFKNSQGKMETSRVDRVDFLLNDVLSNFNKNNVGTHNEVINNSEAMDNEEEDDDLPF